MTTTTYTQLTKQHVFRHFESEAVYKTTNVYIYIYIYYYTFKPTKTLQDITLIPS
jgi:hypothetical protein